MVLDITSGRPPVPDTTRDSSIQNTPRWSIRDQPPTTTTPSRNAAPARGYRNVTSRPDDASLTPSECSEKDPPEAVVPEEQDDSAVDLDSSVHQPRSVASAALVARGALKSGYLWKMGSNVPRWKRRFCVLKPITMLFYYMSEHDTEPRGCIDLDLFDAVRRVGVAHEPSSTTSKRTAFEIYRSGFPEGSGFMLEARGHEDWEEWVETIANSRHGKMQAETDLLKSTNKLLLEEIRGLERQVATFRGYADQRHVTVLALRNERHRNRELASELADLGDLASELSAHLEQAKKTSSTSDVDDDTGLISSSSADGSASPSVPSPATYATASVTLVATAQSDAAIAQHSSEGAGDDPARASSSGCRHSKTSVPAGSVNMGVSEENSRESEESSIRSIRRALNDARKELDRLSTMMREEVEARKIVEGEVRAARVAARAAEERATGAEISSARARGRVSVLERNVEYLQRQQEGLRADLCQAHKLTQVMRAQRAVLKKEIRDTWAKKDELATLSPGDASPAARRSEGRRSRTRSSTATKPFPRSRSWRSTGDLVRAGGEDCGLEGRADSRAGSGATVVPSVPGEVGAGTAPSAGKGLSAMLQPDGIRPSVSGVSLAASDAGDTDMAEQSTSEMSDDESTRSNSHEGRQLVNSIRRRIRRRVGDADIPALPPPRQQRILEAIRKFPPNAGDLSSTQGNNPPVSTVGVTSTGEGSPSPMSFPPAPGAGATVAGAGAGNAPGFGMAGMILSGLGKGMVEKAAQGVGKHLALWPSGTGATGGDVATSLGSSTAGHTLQGQMVRPSASPPRMSGSRSALSLADLTSSRRGLLAMSPRASDRRNSTSATDATTAKSAGFGMRSASSASSLVTLAASPAVPPVSLRSSESSGASLPNSVSRTALIQLADLELAEPCGHTEVDEPPSPHPVIASATANRMTRQQDANPGPLPPRPLEAYELVFKTRVIGLQFCASSDNQAVVVQGLRGYTGAAPSGVPGERLRPDIGDVLESYNGVSARGKSAEVVAREIAACGRPLRLGFRSLAVVSAVDTPSMLATMARSGAESVRDESAFYSKSDALAEKGGIVVSSPGVPMAPSSSCAVAQGAVDASLRMHSDAPWREALSIAPTLARS